MGILFIAKIVIMKSILRINNMNYLETQFWKIAIWLIKRGYGADCDTHDLDDFNGEARCPSCKAKDIIEWIEEHIELLNYR